MEIARNIITVVYLIVCAVLIIMTLLQNKEKGIETSYEEVLENIKDRDYRDSNREIAPLRKAEDAIYIDSSDMTIEEVVEKVIDIIKMARI